MRNFHTKAGKTNIDMLKIEKAMEEAVESWEIIAASLRLALWREEC